MRIADLFEDNPVKFVYLDGHRLGTFVRYEQSGQRVIYSPDGLRDMWASDGGDERIAKTLSSIDANKVQIQ